MSSACEKVEGTGILINYKRNIKIRDFNTNKFIATSSSYVHFPAAPPVQNSIGCDLKLLSSQ